jgi:hypothetical protein
VLSLAISGSSWLGHLHRSESRGESNAKEEQPDDEFRIVPFASKDLPSHLRSAYSPSHFGYFRSLDRVGGS